MFPTNAWPEARIAHLRNLHAAGASATVIAGKLSIPGVLTVTRNAVCGKIHRLGLVRTKAAPTPEEIEAQIEKRRARQNNYQRQRRGSVAFKPRVFTNAPETKMQIEDREPLNLTLADLTMKDNAPAECRFITNDDLSNATYCGHPVDGERSWCRHHRLILQPPKGWIAPTVAPKIAVAA